MTILKIARKECLLFGSIMSAVDPVTVIAVFEEVKVNMVLYISVFGESILNDGVAVVLYQVFESFLEIGDEAITFVNLWRAVIKFSIVAGGGTLMGCVFGYLGSFVFKATKKFRMLEPMFIFINCYTAYLIAELLDLSAILSIIFCAFVMMDRSESEMSSESHVVVKYSLKMMANTAEIIIFIMLGLTSVQEFMTDFAHNWNTGLFVTTLIAVTVYRFMSVYGLTWILNQFRVKPIPYNDQFVMSLSGLRGGIAFSLTKVVPPHLLPHIHQMLTTCIGIIFFTSFVQGGSIGPLVEYLKIKSDDNHFDQPHLLDDDEEQDENKEKREQLEMRE